MDWRGIVYAIFSQIFPVCGKEMLKRRASRFMRANMKDEPHVILYPEVTAKRSEQCRHEPRDSATLSRKQASGGAWQSFLHKRGEEIHLLCCDAFHAELRSDRLYCAPPHLIALGLR